MKEAKLTTISGSLCKYQTGNYQNTESQSDRHGVEVHYVLQHMAPSAKTLRSHAKPAVSVSAMAKKLATTIYITELQQQQLKELNRRSKVPIAEYIREGIDLVLERHSDLLPGQMDLLSAGQSEPKSERQSAKPSEKRRPK